MPADVKKSVINKKKKKSASYIGNFKKEIKPFCAYRSPMLLQWIKNDKIQIPHTL